MKIGDERLKDLIAHARAQHNMIGIGITGDTLTALRELRDYRKAVREYLEAVDLEKMRRDSSKYNSEEWQSAKEHLRQSEATLRALQERT